MSIERDRNDIELQTDRARSETDDLQRLALEVCDECVEKDAEIERLQARVRELETAVPPGRVTLFRHGEPETGLDCRQGWTVEFDHGELVYDPNIGPEHGPGRGK